MKKVVNNQGHPVTPEGQVPTIAAHGTGRVEETLPANRALIADGVLSVVVEQAPKPKRKPKPKRSRAAAPAAPAAAAPTEPAEPADNNSKEKSE